MTIGAIRRVLYGAARSLGDLDAARRGPRATGRRVVRKRAYRGACRATSRALAAYRRFGL